MKKPLVEKIDKDLETVEDMIEALMQTPKGYLLHPLGQKCEMLIDHAHRCVYLDDPDQIEEFIDEAEDENETLEKEIPDHELESYSFVVFAVMGYSDLCGNGNMEAQLYGVFNTEKAAKECGEELVEAEVIGYYEIETPLLDEFGYK